MITEAELERVPLSELSWLQSQRKQLGECIDAEAEREGEALTGAYKVNGRPKRKPSKVPGWRRFKVRYHK